MMRLGTCLECIGSSLRVSGACQDSVREFVGRRLRLVKRLSQLRHRAKDWMMQIELVGSLLGDSLKGSGSSLGTCWEIIVGRP
ncbi:hypothetical protein B296_00034085 [Ensete ventricosum]|uniref:Uncharacterized protein n=1 Tax=Ensete ventricosum TaxID=4639 RepID=A0A426Z3D4_ENSVE|nr:hypothetical protein B296_00034085 [Ensete ventricosum]